MGCDAEGRFDSRRANGNGRSARVRGTDAQGTRSNDSSGVSPRTSCDSVSASFLTSVEWEQRHHLKQAS